LKPLLEERTGRDEMLLDDAIGGTCETTMATGVLITEERRG